MQRGAQDEGALQGWRDRQGLPRQVLVGHGQESNIQSKGNGNSLERVDGEGSKRSNLYPEKL